MTTARPLRADARRNRDLLLDAAVRAFSRDGAAATLDGIAKDAGVGIGTLYRHFPTREALVEAAYRGELARLCDAAGELLAELPPDRALRAWMDRFVDYMRAKQGMRDVLNALVASGGDPFARSRDRMVTALGALLDAGRATGALRADVDAEDVLLAVSGVMLAAGKHASHDRVTRLLDVLVDGLRPQPTRR